MVDTWQVAEARAIGADAILIIVAALEDSAMADIEAAAIEHGMDVLVEVHDEAEMERAARLQSRLIGVNNRDLKRFVTDLGVTERLVPLAPEGTLLVGESGITGHADCQRLARAGVRSFLVGESLMRESDVTAATRTCWRADMGELTHLDEHGNARMVDVGGKAETAPQRNRDWPDHHVYEGPGSNSRWRCAQGRCAGRGAYRGIMAAKNTE